MAGHGVAQQIKRTESVAACNAREGGLHGMAAYLTPAREQRAKVMRVQEGVAKPLEPRLDDNVHAQNKTAAFFSLILARKRRY